MGDKEKMKKRIVISGIFAALLILSMPIISSIQIQDDSLDQKDTYEENDCILCPNANNGERIVCEILNWYLGAMDEMEEMLLKEDFVFEIIRQWYLFANNILRTIIYTLHVIAKCY